MSVVGFVVHHDRRVARELVHDAAAWLDERGHEVRLPGDDAKAVGLDHLGAASAEELVTGLDLGVSVGGDGTMLRAVDLLAPADVPVLGINVGHLGYLTTVEPDGMRMALKRFLSGAYEIESRMLLQVDVEVASGGAGGRHTALNEVVLEKTPMGHTVRLAVDIDDARFTTYAADGLIVATPTGSTAYSFSARGPIVAPNHRALVITPVSPHMLFDRSLVLEPESKVRIEVIDERPATVSVDGRNLGELAAGDVICCTAASTSARLVTFRPRDFLDILKVKFGLEDR